ncbi:GAF domain-containing protein, partial [Pseudonocardia sp.]|uniref:sensor histidine kinase n=1 Tax=Pseudonocardia sp. TaxID=60912 RepID=UPI0031FC338A
MAAAGAERAAVGRSERIAEEQAALRRVAMLVARAAAPAEVFAAVAAEVGRLLEVDFTILSRYESDGAQVSVGAWSDTAAAVPFPVGTRVRLGGRNVVSLVVRTRRPARIDDYAGASGSVADAARGWGLHSAVGAPISVEGRLWGVISVASGQEQPLPPDTEARLAGFTELVATAIANAQARTELRGYAEEQAALRRVATLVAGGAPPEEVFAAVTAEVGRVLHADLTVLGRYDPDGAQTVVGAWSSSGGTAPFSVGTRVELGGRNIATIDDYADTTSPAADLARKWGFRSAVGAPIRVEGRLWGVVNMASAGEEPLPADTEARLAGFAELVASAIANAQARVELRRYAEEQAALRRVATLVARATPPEEVFAAVAAEVGQLLSAEQALLNRYDPDGTATALAPWSSTGGAVPFPVGTRWSLGGRNVTTLVFRTRRPARIDDYAEATGPAADLTRTQGVRSIVGAPISVEGRLWGFISVMTARAEPLPADTEARLAGFTELVATAIANTQARVELRGFAEEQAALRRVATLVARGAPPEQVFAAVAAEVGRLLSADVTALARYDPDGAVTLLGQWSAGDALPLAIPVGARFPLGSQDMSTLVFQTGRPARITDYAAGSGPLVEIALELGYRSAVGVPISVGGRRLWGVMSVVSTHEEPLAADTEARLAGFTELVGTAIANAEAQAAQTASRARIVAAADTTRRRIERDLHDGAQQRLVSLALQLRSGAQASPRPGADALAARMNLVADGMIGVLDELREIARGLHPAALAEGGLRPALKALARRSAIPVRLDLGVDRRLPEPIELAA